MKKHVFSAIVILAAFSALSGCASTNKKTETEEVFIVKREFITGGLAGDCPVEVKTKRAEVPTGTVTHVKYYSNTCKMERPFNIWLPASYDGQKEFPVVYFQHGIFCDENTIINDEKNAIKEIVSNLVADGEAKDMIIVFGNMFATTDPNQKPSFNEKDVLPYDNFINELVNDLMPYVETHYKVLKGRENTAVCGFSMGGRESLFIGLSRPDLFGYVGAIAPAPGLVEAKDWAMTHKGQLAESDLAFKENQEIPEFFMICCGTNDSVVGQYPKTYHKILEKNETAHTWFEVIGADHNDLAIRSGFYWFVKHLFGAEN